MSGIPLQPAWQIVRKPGSVQKAHRAMVLRRPTLLNRGRTVKKNMSTHGEPKWCIWKDRQQATFENVESKFKFSRSVEAHPLWLKLAPNTFCGPWKRLEGQTHGNPS